MAIPFGRKAGVVPGTQVPRPPFKTETGSPMVKIEPKPGNPGWPSPPSSLRACCVVSVKKRTCGGFHLDRAHIFVFGKAGLDDEIAILVGTVGLHGVRLGHLQNEVRRA